MSINRFFTSTLGANLKNARWSWGAVDQVHHRLFLRVWKDQIRVRDGVEQVLIDGENWLGRSGGYAERRKHVEMMRRGADAYGVVCVARDPDTDGARSILTFDDRELVQLGAPTNDGGNTYSEIVARIPIADLAHPKTSAGSLANDLLVISRLNVDSTAREAMISARVGQGQFRHDVLKLWNGACAVTGSRVLDVVRASHIKPWRDSTNEERLDPANGLPLVANLDALFDAGLVTFDTAGNLLVSDRLDRREMEILGLRGMSLRAAPCEETAEYLAYHRGEVFRN